MSLKQSSPSGSEVVSSPQRLTMSGFAHDTSKPSGERLPSGGIAEAVRKIAPAFFKVSDAVAYSSLSRSQIYKLLKQGRVRSKYLGSRNLIVRASLDEFLNSLPDQKPARPVPDYRNNKVR